MSKEKSNEVWKDVSGEDFRIDSSIDDADVAEFNKAGMVVYQANVNYARQIARAEDSLKPVERRILYMMYTLGATPGEYMKSNAITGRMMYIHNHSDISAHASMIDLAQYWKNNVPLVTGECNLGVITAPNEYAASRYADLCLTKYAYECFFSDYDKKAVNVSENLIRYEEPEILPSKFPNILVNGNSGIGNGFASSLPPFNINDVITICKKVIRDPDVDVKELVIAPDFPSECDIIENKSEIEKYCTTGVGKVVVRGTTEIVETPNTWVIVIKSLPYGVPFPTIYNKIVELGKAGVIQLKALHEESEAYVDKDGLTRKRLHFDIEIPKAADPIKTLNILYKNCSLEKTIALQATVVTNDIKTTIKTMNIKELITTWLDTRRMYKRSLYNHKINQLISIIEIDKAMIVLLSGKNLEKTIDIVKHSTSDNIVEKLMTEFKGEIKLDSNHASVIAQKPLSAFTKDAAQRYKDEMKRCEAQLDEITKIAYDPRKIDEIILKELDDLKKYAPAQRRSNIIKVDNEKEFSATNHRLVITTKGYVKKLPEVVDSRHQKQPYGAFEANDRIMILDTVNNVDAIILFNAKGRYSVVPIKDIDNTLYNQYGSTIFDISKLDGKIVSTFNIEGNNYKPSKISDNIVIMLTKQGFMKRSKIEDFVSVKDIFKPIKNGVACKLREKDLITQCIVIPASICDRLNLGVLVFTKQGDYVYLKDYKEISELSRNAMGVQILSPKMDDKCVGFQMVSPEQKYAIIVTKKGTMKRIELEYLGESKRRKDASYIATIREGDEILDILTYDKSQENDILLLSTKSGDKEIMISDIPILGRKAKPVKMAGISDIDCVAIRRNSNE
jgi:DNA gyrase subunit A